MNTITWVRKPHNFGNLVFMYANIVTGEKVQEYKNGQCTVFNSTQSASKPLEYFVPKEFPSWDFWPGENWDETPTIGSYCCDGDGFVTVEMLVNGSIRLLDQGEYMLDLSEDIDQAIAQAAEYLKEQYPGIYSERLAG